MSEKRIEELGFAAANEGFFKEWHHTASLYLQKDPKIERVEAYEQAYKKFSGTVE
jgi:hypothetical protein